jgi:hypothetical protein
LSIALKDRGSTPVGQLARDAEAALRPTNKLNPRKLDRTFPMRVREGFVENGRIVEMGDHASLLAEGGIYARLWAHQSCGFLGEEVDDAEGVAA